MPTHNFPVSSEASVLVITDVGAVARVLTCDLDSITYKRSRAIAKSQTFCDVRKSPQPSDGQIQLSGLFNGDTNELDAVFDGLFRTLNSFLYKYGPEGSATGLTLYSGQAFLTDYQIQARAGQNVLISATMEINGDDVRTTWP